MYVRLIKSIILLIMAGIIAVLLIAAYVVTPVVSWLVANPLAGLVLFAIMIILASIALIRELST